MLIKLQSLLKKCIWGSEAWELSNNRFGICQVASGCRTGLPFDELIDIDSQSLLGSRAQVMEEFPILVKEIRAQDTLSIQVHPDDDYARIHESQPGKTECWYIEDCDDDAFIYYGFNKNTTREEVEAKVHSGQLLEIINRVPVKKGDIFFVKPGTIHAIGKGISVIEVQQNSNVTYRVYDYNRKDAFGNSRELHLDKALDVMNYKRLDVEVEKRNDYVICDYFMMYPIVVDTETVIIRITESFYHFAIAKGTGVMTCDGEELHFSKGDSIFVDAGSGLIKITGSCEVIVSRI